MVDPEVIRKNKEYEDEFWNKINSGEIQLYSNEYLEDQKHKEEIQKNKKYAHPDTMGKTEAKILLVLGLIGSLIFVFWPWLWIMLFSWYFGKDRV